MTDPVRWADAPELPADAKFQRLDSHDHAYLLLTLGQGLVGTVTRHEKAMPVYRNRRGRSSNGGGTYVEWAWASFCGHLSSKSPGRGRYTRRDTAAMVMLAEVERHDCSTVIQPV